MFRKKRAKNKDPFAAAEERLHSKTSTESTEERSVPEEISPPPQTCQEPPAIEEDSKPYRIGLSMDDIVFDPPAKIGAYRPRWMDKPIEEWTVYDGWNYMIKAMDMYYSYEVERVNVGTPAFYALTNIQRRRNYQEEKDGYTPLEICTFFKEELVKKKDKYERQFPGLFSKPLNPFTLSSYWDSIQQMGTCIFNRVDIISGPSLDEFPHEGRILKHQWWRIDESEWGVSALWQFIVDHLKYADADVKENFNPSERGAYKKLLEKYEVKEINTVAAALMSNGNFNASLRRMDNRGRIFPFSLRCFCGFFEFFRWFLFEEEGFDYLERYFAVRIDEKKPTPKPVKETPVAVTQPSIPKLESSKPEEEPVVVEEKRYNTMEETIDIFANILGEERVAELKGEGWYGVYQRERRESDSSVPEINENTKKGMGIGHKWLGLIPDEGKDEDDNG